MAKIGRNNPCPCGSGKKYKNCCERIARKMVAQTVKEKPKKMLTQGGLNRCFLKLVKDAGDSIEISCEDIAAIPKEEILGIRYDEEKDSFRFEKVKVVKKGKILTLDKRLRLPNKN